MSLLKRQITSWQLNRCNPASLNKLTVLTERENDNEKSNSYIFLHFGPVQHVISSSDSSVRWQRSVRHMCAAVRADWLDFRLPALTWLAQFEKSTDRKSFVKPPDRWTLKNVITSESKETAAVFYMNICSTGLKYMYSGAVLKYNSYIGLLVLFLLTSFLLCSLILLQYYYFTMLTVLFAPIATIMWH